MDSETQRLVNELRRIETRVYFILLLGYFRSRPIVFNFTFTQVSADLDYVRAKYFSDKDMSFDDLSPTTKTKLINKLLKYTGFTAYQSKFYKEPLLKRLNDVVKINLEPRYVFDECIAYFGQNRIERERKQKEGIVKAQQKGLYHGRQPDLEVHERIASFTEVGFSINKTAEAVGVSRSTVIRVRKKIKNSG